MIQAIGNSECPTRLVTKLTEQRGTLADPVVLIQCRRQVHRHDKVGRMTWTDRSNQSINQSIKSISCLLDIFGATTRRHSKWKNTAP